jgi:myosin-1
MDQAIGQHGHYQSRTSSKDRKMPQDIFVLKHYAGGVTYSIGGFVDKNMDTLFKDLSQAMFECDNPLLKEMFPDGDKTKWLGASKRPETAGSAFKKSMASMIQELNSKEPSYIRCIKPNEKKRPNVFDAQLVLNQVRYLGLVENVKVRRAGYCYRAPMDKFLDRFKLVCPHTYPVWNGSVKDGIHEILLYAGVTAEEFEFGRTKVFIKNPQTVFKLESSRDAKIEAVVRKLQLAWRAFCIRRKRGNYMDELMGAFKYINTDPNYGRYFKWPSNVPRQMISGDLYLKKVHANWWAWKKLSLIPSGLRTVLRIRVYAWRCLRGDFRDRQIQPEEFSKPLDINQPLGPIHAGHLPGYEEKTLAICQQRGDTKVIFSTEVRKLNRSGKLDRRVILLTDLRLYIADRSFKITPKRAINLTTVKSVSLNKTPDSVVVVKASMVSFPTILFYYHCSDFDFPGKC